MESVAAGRLAIQIAKTKQCPFSSGVFAMRLTCLISAALFALATSAGSAQDSVDNGEFTVWSKYKKGASITIKMSSIAAGMNTELTTTTTLIEVGADKLVIEQTAISKIAGMEFKTPAAKRDVPKKVTIPKGVKLPPTPDKKPEGTYDEGTETLKIAGMEVKTKWYKYRSEMDGLKTEAKLWVADEIPGGLVKMEAKTTGLIDSTSTMELVEFKKP